MSRTRTEHPLTKSPYLPLIYAVVISLFYWIYLFFTAKIEIIFDAITFEGLGQLLYSSGWAEYLKTGPTREPLYPLLVSYAMAAADLFHVHYHVFQKIFQLLIIFATQLLSYKILRKLNIHSLIIFITILYMGFSPSLINSAFSLFYEIPTYPFVLLIILVCPRIWGSLFLKNTKNILIGGFILGSLFLCCTFTKALFGYVFIIFTTPIFVLLFYSINQKNKTLFTNTLLLIITVFSVFQSVMIPYKLLNKKYNGHYMFTDRGGWVLYGNTAKRMQPLTFTQTLSCAAFTMGDNVCYSLFKKEDCDHWILMRLEEFGGAKRWELTAQYGAEKAESQLIVASAQKALENPAQYFLITFIETFKLFFWESTKIGCVTYPKELAKLFEFKPFQIIIRFPIAILSLLSFFYLGWQILKLKNSIFWGKLKSDETTQTLLWIFMLTASFIIAHSFFYVLTRYIFPIIALELISIAYMLDKIFFKKKKT